MRTNRKKLLILLMVIGALFLLSGCSAPVDDNGKIVQITTDTTFSQIFESESWFNALFVYPLAQAINYLTPKIGVAGGIATVTFLVQAFVLLLTLKSTIATQQMQMLQPEMNRITRKYEGKTDDASKMRQAQEMQNLYKKYNINPFATLLTAFIQFPIIIAIYQAVQRSYAVTTGSMNIFSMQVSLEVTPWDGILKGEWIYLIIFLIMAVLYFLSMQIPMMITKYKAKKEAEIHHRKPEETKNPMGNMMYYMMIPILVLSIMWPTGMSIYWIISSLVIILRTLLVQFVFIDKIQNKNKVGK
ncbi:MAG: membrane protein insertase YidC [Erysipelotrichaceae bacterium]|nr:membrane protein insertase YidC [Erysipelotrichaceae bacterium]MDY5251172.1 membrane protein insertase YidC [Erysipelotrichaceae bacterium]